MDGSSFSPASSLHLAVAALIGASLMAVSAFYIHKRSVDQVLQRLIEIRRTPSRSSGDQEQEDDQDDDDDSGDYRRGYGSDGEGTAIDCNNRARSFRRSMDENVHQCFGISGSIPNVASSSKTDWFEKQSVGYAAQDSASSVDNPKFVPSGLSPLGMDRMYLHYCLNSRICLNGYRIFHARKDYNFRNCPSSDVGLFL